MRCLRNIVHILRGCVAAKEAGTEEWKAASTAMVVAVGAVAAKWEGVERVEGRTEADSREVARSEAAAMAAATDGGGRGDGEGGGEGGGGLGDGGGDGGGGDCGWWRWRWISARDRALLLVNGSLSTTLVQP